MATNTKYKIAWKGAFLAEDGRKIYDESTPIAEFSSLDDAKTFLEASGSIGEYQIYTFIDLI
jgi:uncharacterized protein YciI